MLIRQRKQNQYSKVKYIGYIQNSNLVLYPLSTIAFYFFYYQGRDSTKKLLLFRQLEDYYNLYVFPSSVKVPRQLLSYYMQFNQNKKMFQVVGIYLKEKTYSAYKQSVQYIELSSIKETQIRQARCQNIDIIIGPYLSYLPYTFIQLITSFLKEGKGYFLPCVWEVLEEALYLKIQPNIDIQLRYIEAYYLDRAKNKVIQLNLIGLGFLYLLYTLRVIILQDLVVLYREFLPLQLPQDIIYIINYSKTQLQQ